MDQNSILSIIALVVSVGGTIIAAINHKKFRSKCGDKVLEASIDITNTTPEVKKDENKNIII
jgi:hypothetical protein